ncbi:homoserine O-acetyltransferase [Candidatus Sumerlaeota bacterium]|nr:homoserine O-acetyltransferase [Candidatus Sumerlaeota bacterium]
MSIVNATFPESHTEFFTFDGMTLESGEFLGPITIAYQTYGTLSPAKDNAVLLFHAMTGNQNAAGFNPEVPGCPYWNDECQQGWWNGFIGSGCALDTDKVFVICCNYIGGCYGSTGPSSINPQTGKPYAGDFPSISLSDIVDSQLKVIEHLGIETLLMALGGSLGGYMAMDLAARHPEKVRAVAPIASAARTPVLSKVSNFEQIFAIEEDPNFNRGFYYDGEVPRKGLCLARMIANKYFVSLGVLENRAKQHILQHEDDLSGYKMKHQVESYMLYQGKKFVERFDANTYLRISEAWQNYDLIGKHGGGSLAQALAPCKDQKWLVFTINSDVCFYPEMQYEIAQALSDNGIHHQHVTVHSEKGHDAFLLEPHRFTPHIHFLANDVLKSIR